MIKSFELGVLMLPEAWPLYPVHSRKRDNEVVTVPIPYVIPPRRYGAADEPWTWGLTNTGPDVHGNTF